MRDVIDYDRSESDLAMECKSKDDHCRCQLPMHVTIDFKKFREIADEVECDVLW